MSDALEPTAPIYPELGPDFRLHKINMILSELGSQAKHYEAVRKKYNKTRSVTNSVAISTGALSALLASSGIATSLTGPGIVVGIPLSAVGGLCGIISAIATVLTKRLTKKISKHESTVTLAKAKINTVSDLVSKALRDNRIDEQEFALIMAESAKYEQLKNEIRRKSRVEKKEEDLLLRKSMPKSPRKSNKNSLIKYSISTKRDRLLFAYECHTT